MFRPVNATISLSQDPAVAETMIRKGILEIPSKARAIIVFAHGTDSSNLSPRNRVVARSLFQRGFGILLPRLIDDTDEDFGWVPEFAQDEILVKAERLAAIIDWLALNPRTKDLRIGLFGGRDGAAAAMIAAARRPSKVRAIVSRGGRPDLAEEVLSEILPPTLMIVGSNDRAHLDHHRKAVDKMRPKPMLEVIQGATHLFGEPGKMEQVASISSLWFQRNLAMCG